MRPPLVSEQRRAVAQGLRGLVIVNEGSRYQRMVALLVRRPNQLRGEILSEFGMVEEKFLCKGNVLTLYWPRENRYERIEATSQAGLKQAMRKRLLLPLTPEQVVELLLATPPHKDKMRISFGGRSMSLKFKEIELNPRFKPGSFNLDIPKDAEEIR